MQGEIKIPYALKNEKWVHISEVDSGLNSHCFCPCCKGALLAKKGTKVTHHFAHFDNANCQPETILHFIAKNFVYQKLKELLDAHVPLSQSWLCNHCRKTHEADFLHGAKCVHLELTLGAFRPDITILGHDGIPLAAVEIIVTHKPDEHALAYYRQNRIGVIEIEVRDGIDLEKIRSNEGVNVTRIDHCTCQKCKNCGHALVEGEERMIITLTPCRRCTKKMRVCFVRSANYIFRGPKDFNDWQVQVARQNGVVLEKQFSITEEKEYLANTCPKCRKWIGEYYLPNFAPDKSSEESEWEEHLLGYRCINCSNNIPCDVQLISHIKDTSAKIEISHSQLDLFS